MVHFTIEAPPAVTEDVRELAAYRWPGNVREIAAVMDRAVLLGQGRTLEVAAALGQGARATVVPRPAPPEPSAGIEPLDVVMRRHIEAALRATHGRVDGRQGAARLLRINPHTLRARMRKLHVDWRAFRSLDHPPQERHL